MMVATIEIPEGFIPFRYLLWALAAIAAMIAAIIAGNFWLSTLFTCFLVCRGPALTCSWVLCLALSSAERTGRFVEKLCDASHRVRFF